jgi:hypothetical protein
MRILKGLDGRCCSRYTINGKVRLRLLLLLILFHPVERSDDKFFLRGNAGLKLKDHFEILFLLYSDQRNYSFSPKFRGEVFMGFSF